MTDYSRRIAAYGKKVGGKVRRKLVSRTRVLRQSWFHFCFRARNVLLFRKPIGVNIADISFCLTPKGGVVADLWGGIRFERNEICFMLELLKPGMIFMDIGSNVGLFAIGAAKKVGHGRVYASEPCGWTFQVLQENVRLNGLSNVLAVRTAFGDYVGEAVLQVNAPGKDRLNTIGSASHPDCRVVGKETVPITTLDDFVQANGIPRVDVMKVDVEGAELLVFRGGKSLLQRNDAPLILYEGYSWYTKGFGYHPVEIMWLLQDYGYSLLVLGSENGGVALRKSDHGYDTMIVAVKLEHPSYAKLQGNVQ